MIGELTTVEWVRSQLRKKANTTTSITGANGLSGGGTLSESRVITPQYGTTAGTVAAGNHTHTYEQISNFVVAPVGTVNIASLPDGTMLFEYEV